MILCHWDCIIPMEWREGNCRTMFFKRAHYNARSREYTLITPCYNVFEFYSRLHIYIGIYIKSICSTKARVILYVNKIKLSKKCFWHQKTSFVSETSKGALHDQNFTWNLSLKLRFTNFLIKYLGRICWNDVENFEMFCV